MASGIAEIVDRMVTIVEAAVPDYPTATEERFRELPGEQAIEDAPAAGSYAMTNRQFQVWPSPDIRFGQLNGTYIDLLQRVELRVRYSGAQSNPTRSAAPQMRRSTPLCTACAPQMSECCFSSSPLSHAPLVANRTIATGRNHWRFTRAEIDIVRLLGCSRAHAAALSFPSESR